MAAATSKSASLKEYLKRYENKAEEEKKKRKKKKKSKPDALGVVVVDEDPVWQKPVNLEEDEDDSADEEKPMVDEDIEVKRMKRLEQLKLRRPFGAISEDGSGWVPVSDVPTQFNSEEENLDISPPRRHRVRTDTPSLDPDLSPPRQLRRRFHSPSPEPETEALHSSGSVPKRLNPNDQDADISPPRKRRARNDTPSPEPHPKASKSGREVSDLSPPRKQQRRYTSSPEPGMKRPNLDSSPPRRPRPQKSEMVRPASGDLSPPRSNRRSNGADASIVSSGRNTRKESVSLKEQPKTGLVTGQDIKEEIARTKKDDWKRFKDMDPSVSGRGAEPVYRDRATGERISKDELLKATKKDEKPKEIKLEWGKGLAQKREAETRQLELELEKDKPFARTRDDPELDGMLKDRLRWGDPMAHLVKKKHSELLLPDLGDDDKMKESGFVIPQDIPSHSWIKRGLDAAPNRYGIKPGRHWDGVDRSSGFEKKMFTRMNEKQATEREAYLWSVSDM